MELQIVLDTNIPILIMESKFNLQSELERLVPQKHTIVFLSCCIDELNLIAKKTPKLAKQTAFALKYLERFQIIEYNPKNIRFVDDRIIQYAIENNPFCVVVTNDKELRLKLRKKEIPVIFIRTKSHLELFGSILG
ncbi:MAG: type II toxin-antitoxin system VapC family toxin [Candidatus Heimdallarchaeota archaeon]